MIARAGASQTVQTAKERARWMLIAISAWEKELVRESGMTIRCPECNGEGRISEDCPECDGEGQKECESCGGSGEE